MASRQGHRAELRERAVATGLPAACGNGERAWLGCEGRTPAEHEHRSSSLLGAEGGGRLRAAAWHNKRPRAARRGPGALGPDIVADERDPERGECLIRRETQTESPALVEFIDSLKDWFELEPARAGYRCPRIAWRRNMRESVLPRCAG